MSPNPRRIALFIAVLGTVLSQFWVAVWAMHGQEIDALAWFQAGIAGSLMAAVAAPAAVVLARRMFAGVAPGRTPATSAAAWPGEKIRTRRHLPV